MTRLTIQLVTTYISFSNQLELTQSVKAKGNAKMILLLHILFSGIWIGTAATLPFWNYSVNNADNLDSVLNMSDTIFKLKNFLIMGGLTITFGSGIYLVHLKGLPFFSMNDNFSWLTISQVLGIIIFLISLMILYFMIQGRQGRRTYFRYIPPLGYSNIAFIILIYIQMVIKPPSEMQHLYFTAPLILVVLFNITFLFFLKNKLKQLSNMKPEQYARLYFGLLEKEDMTNFFRLFTDDAEIIDPFATGPIRGKKAIERFFQSLGDQFEDISIKPLETVEVENGISTKWKATGKTKNGEEMNALEGTNMMELLNGKIKKMVIDFDLNSLPQVVLVTPQNHY